MVCPYQCTLSLTTLCVPMPDMDTVSAEAGPSKDYLTTNDAGTPFVLMARCGVGNAVLL